jgi:hypothetical protein
MPNDIQAWYPSNSLAFCFFCFDFFHSDAMCTWFTSMMGICSKKVVWVSTYIKHVSLGRYFVWQVILDRDGAVNSRRIYIILYLLIRDTNTQTKATISFTIAWTHWIPFLWTCPCRTGVVLPAHSSSYNAERPLRSKIESMLEVQLAFPRRCWRWNCEEWILDSIIHACLVWNQPACTFQNML